MKKYGSLVLILSLLCCLFASCGKRTADNVSEESPTENNTQAVDATADFSAISSFNTDSTKVDFSESEAEMFTDRDSRAEYDLSTAITIRLNGNSAEASSNAVKISGSAIHITEEATYIINGTLEDGMIVVDAPDNAKLQLVLNGADITSKSSAPLYIKEADKVFVTLAEGTENILANEGGFTVIDDNNIDGTVFSKQDLSFNGSGKLTVTAPAGHGIVCKDDLVFTGGMYTINSSSHAIDANDSVRVSQATMIVNSGKDGIHAENSDEPELGFVYISSGTFTFESEGDGISAGSYLQVTGGNFDITAGGGSENGAKQSSDNYGDFMGGKGMGGRHGGMGGERPGGQNGMNQMPGGSEGNKTTTETESTSMKGLKSTGDLLILEGNFKINSADDAIHSNASMYIKNGTIDVATGDDGIHAEETLEMSDGTIYISESYEGLEALNIKVMGGEITLTASDDGLNAAGGTDNSGFGGRDNGKFGGGMGGRQGGMSSGNGSIVIADGNLNITASGDGIDANGTLEITGGYTIVCGPTRGDTATLDYDSTAIISGGTFIGTGASGMAQTFSDSQNQGVIAVQVGSATEGTKITLTDSSGKEVISHTPKLEYNMLILSSPDIIKGETYTLSVGTQSGEFEAY